MSDEQKKPSKKFAVGDLPPSPTTSTGITNNKRPVRHHVKRRSSGRVHVSKLAPMAKAQDTDDTTKKPMKRSQSNKSLNRLSSLERKSTMTGMTAVHQKEEEPNSPPTTPPHLPVSSTSPAAPVEQSLHATADDLVTPELKSPLTSQFVELKNKPTSSITRTQQKLLLQREQSLIHDENNIAHPKNMIRLTREMEKMGKEYRCVRKYQDPMMESLARCQDKLHKRTIQRTLSSRIMPNHVPHMEQRRQILLKTALQQQQEPVEDESNRWSASHLLERLFYGS